MANFHLNADHDGDAVRRALIEIAQASQYRKPDTPVTVVAAETPWGTHYKAKAYVSDNRLDEAGGWEKLAVPFFRHVWPRERKFQTADTTRTLMFFLDGLGTRFPEGVHLVLDLVVPSDDIDMFVFRFGREKENGRADLTTQFPHETLLLLSKVIDETRQRPPYGLADVLSRLAETAPELRHDERWQRLHRLTLTP